MSALSRTNRFRLGWFLAALLQLVLPAFATVADARAEAESRGASAHVESHGTPRCARVHPADCVVCRVLAGGAAPSSAPAIPVAIARAIEAEPARLAVSCIATRRAGDPPQRAPPT
ncbi:MAG: hypothetical protein ABI625_07440 [bacterium]